MNLFTLPEDRRCWCGPGTVSYTHLQVVPGFLFYSYTKSRAVNAARMAAESVLEEIEDTLEDALE